IKGVRSGKEDGISQLDNQLEISKEEQVKKPVQEPTFLDKGIGAGDRERRLAQQFTRSRMSIGSSRMQESLSKMLAAKNRPSEDYSKENLRSNCDRIETAAKRTDEERQQRTEGSLNDARDIIENGTDSQRATVGKPLVAASDSLDETDQGQDTLNKILDTL